jgi:hypothetical protein
MNNISADFQIFLINDINDTLFITLTLSMKNIKIK